MIHLTWSAPTNSAIVTGYTLICTATNSEQYYELPATPTSFELTNLVKGTDYVISLVALNNIIGGKPTLLRTTTFAGGELIIMFGINSV